MALGGVSLERIPQLSAWGFGGFALLGDVWRRLSDRDAFTDYLAALKACAEKY
jgi:thiamine-phosphate pyrophosphorylase